MLEVTRFFGIVIKIFFRGEHNPPHFHAVYGEYNGLFSIEDLRMIEGDLSAKAQKLVQEWAKTHQSELMDMWNSKTLRKLPPLD